MAEGSMNVGGYELRNCVASGATTQIWEVTEQGGSVQLAMKLMLEEARKKPEMKAVLKHEFRVGKSLEHPSIIRFHKLEITRDHAFFIMDYFRAPSLKTHITTNLAEIQSRFKKMVEAVCQAYTHMHEKGWLHRDIKPDNILVNKTGEVRIIDFSLSTRIAKGIGKLLAVKSKAIQGTRTYIPPEIILKKTPTVQSDIYSLGVTLYEVLTGSPPFAGMSPNDLLKKHLSELAAAPSLYNANIAPELDQIILKMLSKKPKDRYADMRELSAAFRNVRCFLEDPVELHERRLREAKELETVSVDKRLDSRADADRTTLGLAAPAKPTKAKRKTAPIGELEPVRKATPAPGNQPAAAMPGMMPYGMPQPMMMPPMMPQQMMPQPMMPPQMMMPPMMPQQMMPQPGMPQPMMPQPGMPPQMMPPQMLPPQGMQPPTTGMLPPQGMPATQPVAAHPAVQPPQMPTQPQVLPSVPQSPVAVPAAVAAPATVQPSPAAPPATMPAAAPAAPPAAAVQPSQNHDKPRSVLLPLERRKAPAARPKGEEDENLEFMTELPDIM